MLLEKRRKTEQPEKNNIKMVDLIHERFATYYHADKMSTTFIFCFLLYIIMVITPFLISFTAGCTFSKLTKSFG